MSETFGYILGLSAALDPDGYFRQQMPFKPKAQRKINGMSVYAMQTCPICGRKNVNVYATGKGVMCKKCKDKQEATP